MAVLLPVYLSSAAALYLVNRYVANTMLNFVISFSTVVLLTFLYKTTLQQKLMAIFVLPTIGSFSETMGANAAVHFGLMQYTTGANFELSESDNQQFWAIAISCKILAYIFVLIFRIFFKDLRMIVENSSIRKQYISLVALSLLSYAVIVIINMEFVKGSISFDLSLLIEIIMIVINLIIYSVYYQVIRLDNIQMEKRLLQEEYQHKLIYYNELEEHQQEIRKIRHDMKNRLFSILSAVSGQDRVEEQIHAIMEEINCSEQRLYCENPQINMLLNVKMQLAEEKGIRTALDIKVPPSLQMNPGDLGILAGNLLDNALEAAEKCPEDDRYVRFCAYYYNQCLVFSCENSIAQPAVTSGTSKEDPFNHGIGLKSIDDIIKKYSGKRTTDITEHCYKTEINIWLQ